MRVGAIPSERAAPMPGHYGRHGLRGMLWCLETVGPNLALVITF